MVRLNMNVQSVIQRLGTTFYEYPSQIALMLCSYFVVVLTENAHPSRASNIDKSYIFVAAASCLRLTLEVRPNDIAKL